MAKTISASGSGAVRTILKNKEAFEFALRSKETEGNRIRYFYDVFMKTQTERSISQSKTTMSRSHL